MKSLTELTFRKWLLFTVISICIFSACQKQINHPSNLEEIAAVAYSNSHGHLKQTKTFSSEVVVKWIQMNNRLLLTTPRPAPGVKSNREFGYIGIAVYESVVPGMPGYQSLSSQLDQMPAMPSTLHGLAYHWAISANAALAAMNRYLLPMTSQSNKTSMDSLEAGLNLDYRNQDKVTDEVFYRSVAFGKEVAQRVFNWSISDKADQAFNAYTLPVGAGLWVPTPGVAAAVAPYWGNNRVFVPGSLDETLPPPPLPYSEDPSSDYYQMEKEVYDVSANLTPDQNAIAMFWLDAGFGAGGHWQSILRQVLIQEESKLDIAALAYAKGGIYINDATISSFRTKYVYNVQRPITYIRTVLNHPTWNPLFATPGHPDYSSAHTVQSKAIAVAFTSIFGQNHQYTDHTFDNLGMPARTYSSFDATAQEVAVARVYAGIHTRMGCDAGLLEGLKVAQNINNKLKFLKE